MGPSICPDSVFQTLVTLFTKYWFFMGRKSNIMFRYFHFRNSTHYSLCTCIHILKILVMGEIPVLPINWIHVVCKRKRHGIEYVFHLFFSRMLMITKCVPWRSVRTATT
jgi:hypothetical protein